MSHRAPWLTDIHLNFVTRQRVADLAERIGRLDVHSILIGGDIGEAAGRFPSFGNRLSKTRQRSQKRPTAAQDIVFDEVYILHRSG